MAAQVGKEGNTWKISQVIIRKEGSSTWLQSLRRRPGNRCLSIRSSASLAGHLAWSHHPAVLPLGSTPWWNSTDSGLDVEKRGLNVLPLGQNVPLLTMDGPFTPHIFQCSQVWIADKSQTVSGEEYRRRMWGAGRAEGDMSSVHVHWDGQSRPAPALTFTNGFFSADLCLFPLGTLGFLRKPWL